MFKWVKRIFLAIVFLAVVLAIVLVGNTLLYTPDAPPASEPVAVSVDIEKATEDLAAAVQFQTDSTRPEHPDFDRFLTFLQETFPAVHATLDRI